jgi:two-component system NtrC family sensor kinase
MHEELHDMSGAAASTPGVPARPSAAKLAFPSSLRSRLPLVITLVVAGVVTTATYAELRSVGRAVEQNLIETADRTAQAVVDDLDARGPGFDAADVRDTLHELIEANTALRSISIVEVHGGETQLLTSTSSEEREELLALGGRAVASAVVQRDRQPQVTMVARPLLQPGRRLAVVASVSMASVEHVETQGRAVLFWFAIPTIAIVTLLIDVVMRRLIHRPIGELRRTIQRVSAGDLSSRAAILRRDELGTVADGLNGMLGQLDRANDVLQQKVADATAELRIRNTELEASNQQMLLLREALTRAERMAAVGQMAASVAHQVGTPLNLVSGYVQVIREDRQTDPAVRERLGIVEQQLSQVTHVLRTVLDRARQPSPRIPLGVAGLVDRACTLVRPRLARAGVTLDAALDAGLASAEVHGDAAQLEIALLSLMANAVDAMPDGGTLRIRGGLIGNANDATIRLEIADTGHGIPPELMPRLFDPWVTTKPEGRGTGLGLGIVREVIHTHGGRVSVTSAPGAGATFTIELPAVAPAASTSPAPESADGPIDDHDTRVPQHAD